VYRGLAYTTFNTLALLVAANIALGVYFHFRDRASTPAPDPRQDGLGEVPVA
jgi:hypothetical protein